MSDNDFDQVVLWPRERPLSSDLGQAFSQQNRTTRDLLARQYGYRDGTGANDSSTAVPQGFLSDGFKVDPGSGMQIILRAGLGLQDGTGDCPTDIGGSLHLDDRSPTKPLILTLPESITVPTADPTNPRIDIVEVKYDRQLNNPQSRGILDLVSGIFNPTLVDKTMTFVLNGLSTVNGTGPINYKTGTPAGSPVEPAVDAGYLKVGAVYVPALSAAIVSNQIGDRRRLLMAGGMCRISGYAKIDIATGGFDQAAIIAPPGVDVVLQTVSLGGPQVLLNIYMVGPFPAAGVAAAAASDLPHGTVTASVTGQPGAPLSFLYSSALAGSPTFTGTTWPAGSPIIGGNVPLSAAILRGTFVQFNGGAYAANLTTGTKIDCNFELGFPLT